MTQRVDLPTKSEQSGKIEPGREYIPLKPMGDSQTLSTNHDQHKGEAR